MNNEEKEMCKPEVRVCDDDMVCSPFRNGENKKQKVRRKHTKMCKEEKEGNGLSRELTPSDD